MNIRTLTLSFAAAVTLFAQADVTLERAALKERLEGDLKGAIELYRRAFSEAKSDRAVAAKALIRMAECYRKLGDTESRKIYEQVVRDFADQKEAMTVARTRLGVGDRVAPQGGMALRKVWTGDISGGISQNGHWLTYVDQSSPSTSDWGRLLLHDMASGADRLLTSRTEGYAYNSAISKDGTQVAYLWQRGSDKGYELRTASLMGTGMPKGRRLFGNEDVSFITPLDWSPDGKWIAVTVTRKDQTAQIGLVAVHDGSLRVLKSVDWRGPTRIFFSPDGQDLAFDLPVNEASNQRDVFVLAADGSREVPAVVYPGNDVVMGWSPDGKRLLFASDRSGSMDLWALAFAERKPQGTPELIKRDIGGVTSIGISNEGALYLGLWTGGHDIEVASIDVATGKQLSPPVRPIQTFIGTNVEPAWSPNGKHLAYASRRGRSGGNVIAIRSVDTGKVQELQLRPALSWFNGLSWAPDGHSFAANGSDLKGRPGVFRIDAQTGEVVPIVMPPPENLSYEGFFWSPDGKRLYYHSQMGTIYERDLASGNQREVIRGNLGPISLSPDGRWIVASQRDQSTELRAVVLIPVEGGEPRELLRVNEPQLINNTSMAWTPDGRAVLVRKMLARGGTSELWLVPIAGGPPRKLDFDANRVIPGAQGKIRLHPDGRQLAYVSGELSMPEVWVLENFLPALRKK